MSVLVLLLMMLSCVWSHDTPKASVWRPFTQLQRGSIFPLVLEHPGIAEAGAGPELQLIGQGGIGVGDLDLREAWSSRAD